MRFKIEYTRNGTKAVMEVEANSLESAERFVKERYPDVETQEFEGLPQEPETTEEEDFLDELELEDDALDDEL